MDAIYHKALNDTTAGATANPLVSDCNCGMGWKAKRYRAVVLPVLQHDHGAHGI